MASITQHQEHELIFSIPLHISFTVHRPTKLSSSSPLPA